MVLLFVANTVLGQEVAVLPSDPEIRTGVLPNGMRWYVATNPHVKGVADFALVQQTGAETIQSIGRRRIEEIAQEALMSQPLLTAPSVQDYFISKGSIPGPEGFAQVSDYATVFRFGNVSVKQSEAVLDSTLLVLMSIAGRCYSSDDSIIKKWYTPTDQAIVVAGDVKADEVAGKLRMLSYMTPQSESVQRPGYVWKNVEDVKTETIEGGEPGLVRVSATWRLERSPRELMHTVQPAIYEKYMSMAGMVARDRILNHFKNAGIPVATVRFNYESGVRTMGDGAFSVEVVASEDDVEVTVQTLAAVLSSIDTHGVDPSEAGKASLEFADRVASETGYMDVSNQEYVDRCLSSFIYNTSLSTRDAVRKFYLSKELSNETESHLLSSVASPSLDGGSNLTLRYIADSLNVSADSLTAIFRAAWDASTQIEPEKPAYVNIPYLPAPETKIKIKSTKKEYLSGGQMWTLSNGVRVIYRNMQTEGNAVHYSLSLSGGSGNVEGLGPDDGGYLADFFDHYKVAGVSGREFREALRRKGVKMSCEVGHSSTTIKGSVQIDQVDYLFRSLIALMNDRQMDPQEWEYYLKCEPLRQAAGCASGESSCLTDDFAVKADSFFSGLSANVNNGVIVIIGDLDEKRLRSVVMAAAGGFRTTDKAFSRTETMNRNFHGTEGTSRHGVENCVEVSLTAPMAMTAENYYTAALASMMLKRHFEKELAGRGVRVESGYECRRFPQESVVIRLTLSESGSGFSQEDALAVMKNVFADMSAVQIDDDVLASYKSLLERRVVTEKAFPQYWIGAINLRYIDGKDFTTGAEDRIKTVTGNNIKKLLATLGSSSRIEYEITGNKK